MGLLKLLPRTYSKSLSLVSSKLDSVMARQYRERLELDSNPYVVEHRASRRKLKRWKRLQRFYDGKNEEQLRLFRLLFSKKVICEEVSESRDLYSCSQGIDYVVDDGQLNLFDENLHKQWRLIDIKKKNKQDYQKWKEGGRSKRRARSWTELCLKVRRSGRTVNPVEFGFDKDTDYAALYNYKFKDFYTAFASNLFHLIASRKGEERESLLTNLSGLTRSNWKHSSRKYLAPILRRDIFDKTMIPKVCASNDLNPDDVFNDLFEEFCRRPPTVKTHLIKYIEN